MPKSTPTPETGLHHPSAFFKGYFPDIEKIYSNQRKERIASGLSSAARLLNVVNALEYITLANNAERATFEQLMVFTQLGLNPERLKDYQEYAQDWDRRGEMIPWFEKTASAAIAGHLRSTSSGMPGLDITKGVALSLGAIWYGGVWPESTDPLDDMIRDIPDKVEEDVSVEVHRKGKKVRYRLYPVYGHEGTERFARLDRSRAVADVVICDTTLHIAKKASSLVIADELPHDARSKFERWYTAETPEETKSHHPSASRSVGTVYEFARQQSDLSMGVLPESAAYIVRKPLRRNSR